ncbi:MAG: nucleotidyltransferase family protein [Actinomycetota bacterium]
MPPQADWIGIVGQVAAWALPPLPQRPLDDELLKTPAFTEEFLRCVAHQRIGGLVAAAADAGALDRAPPHLRQKLGVANTEALRASLAIEAHAIAVSDALTSAGIDHALLKGCATAHLDYPDPELRHTGDVDLFVDRSHFARLDKLLPATGHRRALPPFSDRWELSYAKDITYLAPSGIEVDVHLNLVGGYWGVRSDWASLLQRRDWFDLAGSTLPALDAPGRVIQAAVHSASGAAPRLGSAADVFQITGTQPDVVGAVAERAADLGAAPLVATGVLRSAEAFGGVDTEIATWAQSVPVADSERAALAALASGRGHAVWMSGARALPVPRRVAYLTPLLLPSRQHLRARGLSRVDHLRASMSAVRPRRSD